MGRRAFSDRGGYDEGVDVTPEELERLIEAAAAAREHAYAPYSEFTVGAAIMLQTGEIVAGCNVENASFGLSVCAERNAIAGAVAGGARTMRAAVVVTDSSPPTSPCGACRQVLAEFGDFPVILANTGGERVVTSVSELLPRAFGVDDLRRR